MLAEEVVIDDVGVSVSPWRLAVLHVSFYILSAVSTLGLRSPLWLLLTLVYCGFHRDALTGRSSYPSWLWKVLWGCILTSAVCCVGANVLTLLVQSDDVHHVVWHLLNPLWQVVGVQQWKAAEGQETILFPAIATVVWGSSVLYMKEQDTWQLRIRRDGVESASAQHDSLCGRWPRLSSACRLAAAPLLATLAWAVAWVASPSCVGLWLELMTFVFVGSASCTLLQTRTLSSHRSVSGAMSGDTTTTAAAAATTVASTFFYATIAVLIVAVSATHNAVFTPIFNVNYALCTQLGVGPVPLGSREGARRAVQLLGMIILAAGTAMVDTYVVPSRVAPQPERQNLLVAVEEEEDEGEEGTGAEQHHGRNAASSLDPAHPRGVAPEGTHVDPALCQIQHLFQFVAVACVMALLLHAVFFPNLVSLALWLVHACCCAGGLVVRPQQPTAALFWVLGLCLVALSCAIVAQYVCLVLLVNPDTAAWAWQPALPYHFEDYGVVAAQVVGEHSFVLLLQLYLCTGGITGDPLLHADCSSSAGGEAPLSAAAPPAQTISPRPAAADEREDNDDSPQGNWMLEQLRNAAGNPKELGRVFETAVGRPPRRAELDCLVTSAQSSSPVTFSSACHLNTAKVFHCVFSGPLYTYTIIISLFVLGTSSASMDLLHATCLVLSLFFSVVGSSAVLCPHLRMIPPVWVAIVMGLQLGYRVLVVGRAGPSSASSSLHSPPLLFTNFLKGRSNVGNSALEWREVVLYLAVQFVLLWCYRYEPHPLADWSQVCQCLIFRCRWTRLLRFVRRAAGFVVLVWIVLALPRSANVTLFVLLLFGAALLHHWRWHRLAYVWRRFLLVGYCGVVLLAMLLVEFAPMQPKLWSFLRALGCPVGSEGVCARDVGLPSDTAVWLTPLALPWWFVIVLATAVGTPNALPTGFAAAASPPSSPSTASTPPSLTPAPPVAEALTGWRSSCSEWWPPLRCSAVTVLLLLAMTYAALCSPSLLTTAYLVGPVWGLYPTWIFAVAALHTALQCTYQFWFSPPWLDAYTLWGTPVAELIGLWRAASATVPESDVTIPSTLEVAAAPLLIGLLQALQSYAMSTTVSNRGDDSGGGSGDSRSVERLFTSPIGQVLRRLCASHLYVLLLLCLLHSTQRFVMGWGVAVLLLVVWQAADLRECGVLLRPRWLYRLCATASAGLAVANYALLWIHMCFPHWSVHQLFPWLMGSDKEVSLSTACWTAAAACVALQWSSGADPDAMSNNDNSNSTVTDRLLRHPHSANFITWLRQRIGRHRGAYGIRATNSIADFAPSQRDAFLADAAELLEGSGNAHPAEGEEGRVDADQQNATALLVHAAAVDAAPSALCGVHTWSIAVLHVARLVPVVACGFVAVGAAASSSCLLSIFLLLIGLVMGLRHARLQWSFWRWWRSLLVGCAALPLTALLLGCPPVYTVVVALPPWVGLVVGLSDDATPLVSGDGLRFTARHVVLFFALWVQSCLYNNPQWGVRLLRLQYTEKQLGAKRHVALQQQLEARVARATEEATRVDRETRAYLDGLRAGEDVAEISITSEAQCEGGSAAGREEREEDGRATGEDFDAEMYLRRPPPRPSPTNLENGARRGDSSEAPPPSSLFPVVTVPNAEGGISFSSTAAAASHASSEANPLCSSASRWWRQRCDSGLRRACNVLAAHTYHPSEYHVCATAAAAAAAAAAASTTARSGPAALSLRQLFTHLLLVALQVLLRHTPLALLTCALVNALLTGCLWELLGLCYVVQIALAYHPHAPRLVYQCFGLYVVAGVLLKELVVLWVTFDTVGPIPAFAVGTLLPRQKGSPYPWSSAAAARGSLRYCLLWMDILTLGVVALHERVCVIYGVYVDDHAGRRTVRSASRTGAPSHATPPPSAATDGGNGNCGTAAATAESTGSTNRSPHNAAPPSPDGTDGCGVRRALLSYYANVVSVPGVGEDWYLSYTSVDLFALFVLVATYSHMTTNENLTLQDNVQNNQLSGPMALLLCMSVLQLVVDRMLYVQRCMHLKAAANWIGALVYCLLYWWWRNTVAVSAHAAGNTYFTLKIVALVLSAAQVCRGYPLHNRRDVLTAHPGSLFRYSCFMVFRAIPFVWEMRTLIDWTVQHTALTLQEYLTLEDIHVYVHHCRERYEGKRNERTKVGDVVPRSAKWLFGVSRLALILLALLGPLLYYSTYNPSAVVNRAVQLNLQLSFFGAHDFFATTVHDNASVPDGWWSWLARTRPTVALYGQTATEQTVQLMEFTSCSGSQWMASPQAMRQVLAGLRAAAGSSSNGMDSGKEEDATTAAYILQSMEMVRNTSSATSTTSVSLVHRWPIPKKTAQAMVRILERETGASTTAPPDNNNISSSASDSASSDSDTASAVLPFFYNPFSFNRASRLDVLPTDAHFPHRNRQHCSLELNHERDVALNTSVRYWCLHCAPLFPAGNVPTANTSSAAEWHCLTTGEGCDDFNYEDVNEAVRAAPWRTPSTQNAPLRVPIYVVVLSDFVVSGISFLKGLSIVALYTTFVLALGRLLRSVLANKMGTLVFENMANPAVLENMVRCTGIAREYGDLRLEHTIYLELVDMLRSPERLFEITGSLRSMYQDADQDDGFHLGLVRRRRARRSPESSGATAAI
ncbi:putative transmembrane protein [Leptomonas pyrrhocoris]|uniref:Putative transmembrane protein n=1 Tax=Leptomonas pyrrhocoris TaxID=157538 RepID=A0A0M9G3E2_LEPPY|nr:putative transmembrane protein [Leptomonas pyrrhocoris]KPA81326.1 putative transmembrane protein [Leptomonas pyrrhocoris]|eukprot:XP_015659765.1 putative transmembrane protein [Leptomonas pyrrhocoris]